MPSACVDGDFMVKLTALNKSMLVGAVVLVATKKKKKMEDVGEFIVDGRSLGQKRKVGTGVSVHAGGNADTQKGQDGNAAGEESVRDRTIGILRPSEACAPPTQLSMFYPLHHNRKQLQKLVDAVEPADMHITCDYDFWVWLETQNLFSPLSYKTHDLSVLALKGKLCQFFRNKPYHVLTVYPTNDFRVSPRHWRGSSAQSLVSAVSDHGLRAFLFCLLGSRLGRPRRDGPRQLWQHQQR